MPESIDTNAKALRINLDDSAYGAFAEIGGGQEVSRWFFRVGGAAGTVAKTVSAYDMAVSDAIYGGGERYVSRERLLSMLTHEYGLLIERLAASRAGTTAFFAFADTVATRSFKGGNESHGWIGLRFQHRPGAEPSDIVLHVALMDPTAERQQQSLGVLGVNLIHGALYGRTSHEGFLSSLMDGLTPENIEIDVVDLAGPAFEKPAEPRATAVRMLALGLTPAVVFDEGGRMEHSTSVFRKRALLVHRCSVKRDNPEMDPMMRGAIEAFASEGVPAERGPLPLLELSVSGGVSAPAGDAEWDGLSARIDRLFQPGKAVMLTKLPETFRVSGYLRRHSTDPIRFVFGLDAMVTILGEHFYRGVTGGMLEGLGKLLSPSTRLYVFAMPAEVLRRQLELHRVDPKFWSAPDKAILTAEDVSLAPPAGHLLSFLKSAGWVLSVGANAAPA